MRSAPPPPLPKLLNRFATALCLSRAGPSGGMIGSLSSDSTASAADTDHDDEADEAAVKHELKEVSHLPIPAFSLRGSRPA